APEVLAGEPLVLYPRASGFRDYLDRTLAEAGVTAPRVIMETDSVEAIKSFVEVGLGISFLPGSAVAQEVAIGRLVQAEVSGLNRLTRRTSVLYRTGGYLSGGARRFLEILRERLRTEA
ncbi:MAG: hypothetical protein FJX77_05200, partial [Armatimonadetes bacterium]|nr:hypothetical protein [Armatimonadota bacterium]